MLTWAKVLMVVAIGFVANPAYSYVGPGLGAGVIASILGVIGAGFLALFSLVYYPFKRLIKKRKLAKELELESREPVGPAVEANK
jgi:ATP/ADP translocase